MVYANGAKTRHLDPDLKTEEENPMSNEILTPEVYIRMKKLINKLVEDKTSFKSIDFEIECAFGFRLNGLQIDIINRYGRDWQDVQVEIDQKKSG